MGLCEHDKMMYKKLDYGMLRWIVDFTLSEEMEEPSVMVGAILTKQVGEGCYLPVDNLDVSESCRPSKLSLFVHSWVWPLKKRESGKFITHVPHHSSKILIKCSAVGIITSCRQTRDCGSFPQDCSGCNTFAAVVRAG